MVSLHAVVGLSTFGMSAPGPKVYEAFGFTASALAARAKAAMQAYAGVNGGQNPSLMRYLQQHSVVPAGCH